MQWDAKTVFECENLFSIEDTCSVYVLRGKDGYLLIDCGCYGETAEIPVEAVLITHFHRDQCSSAPLLQNKGARIYIPFAERKYFEDADVLRAGYDIFDNYTSYRQGFTPMPGITPDDYAVDYGHIEWEGVLFTVIPLPGHTFGSVGYLFNLNGTKILAIGDLLSTPEKLWEYYSTQWLYMDFTGHANLLDSLKYIETLDIDLVLPGHGEPFRYTQGCLDSLRSKLERLYELFYGEPYESFKPQFRTVTQSVIDIENMGTRSYLVHDSHGHAVMIDCGYPSTHPIAGNPHRFTDNLTQSLSEDLGIEDIEWFLCSHYHDDHLAGYPCLKARYGTKLVASPELQDILEHPERYDMPCLLPQCITVDRVVDRGEAFIWRGIEFSIEQQPGQTIYNQEIRFKVDGKDFMVVGDSISGLSFSENRDFIYSFIPRNRTPVSQYTTLPKRILMHRPDFLLAGHGGAVPFDGRVQRWEGWMKEWQQIFNSILATPCPDMGMDARWVEFYPYKVKVKPDDRITFTVTVTNYLNSQALCLLSFRSLNGIEMEPKCVSLTLEAGARGSVKTEVCFPSRFTTHSMPILADVTWNGRHLGEIAEAITYW